MNITVWYSDYKIFPDLSTKINVYVDLGFVNIKHVTNTHLIIESTSLINDNRLKRLYEN